MTSEFYVGFPNVSDKAILHKAIDDILASGRLTNNGVHVRTLEDKMSDFLNVRHVIAVCNATVGLQIIAKALGLHGKVIVPSFTFVATVHALEWIGLEPVFCDVAVDHNLSPPAVAKVMDEDIAAIVGVHLWGNACYPEILESVAWSHGASIIFDAAHAFGCSHRDKNIGNFGDAEVFSLHATKCINSFEGGLITTNDDGIADECRRMRNFGFVGYDNVRTAGTNGKMSEIHAAMGLTMLELYPSIVAQNKERFELYLDRLSSVSGIFVKQPDTRGDHNYQYIVIEVREGMTGISRDTVMEKLHRVGIIARRYFYPGIHKMCMYDTGQVLPVTERLCRQVLVLPTGPSLSLDDVTFICDTIEEILS